MGVPFLRTFFWGGFKGKLQGVPLELHQFEQCPRPIDMVLHSCKALSQTNRKPGGEASTKFSRPFFGKVLGPDHPHQPKPNKNSRGSFFASSKTNSPLPKKRHPHPFGCQRDRAKEAVAHGDRPQGALDGGPEAVPAGQR